jgi:hypothetical protein
VFVGGSLNPTTLAAGTLKSKNNGVAISAGWLLGCDQSRKALNNFLVGISGGASYYASFGGGVARNDSGTGLNLGVGFGKFNYGGSYNQYQGNLFMEPQ